MAPDERARHTLYTWMQETADDEKADALMASLPPTSWPELATKHDLELVEHKLTSAFHTELTGQTKTFIAWTGGLTVTLAAFFATVTAIAVR